MAGHAQLKFVMTECSKTQIRLTGLNCFISFGNKQLNFGILTLRPWKKLTWGLNYFDQFTLLHSLMRVLLFLMIWLHEEASAKTHTKRNELIRYCLVTSV